MTISISDIQQEAARLGFARARICAPDAVPQMAQNLATYIAKGYHGQMAWLAERQTWRAHPDQLWQDARSVIMLADCYTPDHDPRHILNEPERGAISVYAQNKDYHDVIKKRLKACARWLIAKGGGEVKVFVDTAPVPEKPLAQAAGLGWQGKHTNLVSRDLGNWFFLGAIFSTLDLPKDVPESDHCGTCTACLQACPTNAFPAPYQLDARRCISYLTIEHKGPIEPALRPLMGNRIYGCDDCLAACPWNKFAQEAQELRYAAREDLRAPALAELVQLDDAAFRQKFSGSPIKRIGRARFVRNVLYAIGNSGTPALRQHALKLCLDTDPNVAEAASWAVAQLER